MPKRILNPTRFRHPGRVVNLCFAIVLLCSTLLTWREVVVLENAYLAGQRNSLDTIATALDRHLQYGVDRLLFYRSAMEEALDAPVIKPSQQALADFFAQRDSEGWLLNVNDKRGVPLRGVSDDYVEQTPYLNREEERLNRELTAASEFSYLMNSASADPALQRNMFYTSRAGFYLSPAAQEQEEARIRAHYHRLVNHPYFSAHSKRSNPARGVRWTHSQSPVYQDDRSLTASVPLDHEQRWYGVLALDFRVDAVTQFLLESLEEDHEADIVLYDSHFQVIAATQSTTHRGSLLTAEQKATLAQMMKKGTEGDYRLGARFISWARLSYFDGVLVRVDTLAQSASGEFGKITLVLALLWLLFTSMLILSWVVIRRMVRDMYQMQHHLQWRAWYDTLTRLYNRGAFFDRAKNAAARCREQNQPCAVIQLDLDHFKSINDRFGHQAGDRVLSHAAGLVSQTLRAEDIAGRVGGEEFCILLPGATRDEAERVAERIRTRLNAREILITQNTTLRISGSLGVSGAQEEGTYDFEQLQLVADRRLYLAKQSGRNGVRARD